MPELSMQIDLAIISIAVIGVLMLLRWGGMRRKQNILAECDSIIDRYNRELGRERFSHGYTDAYGIRRYDKWEKRGRTYFFEKVLLEEHSSRDSIQSNQDIIDEVLARIDAVASDNEFSNQAVASVSTGDDYEEYCEKLLTQCGWKVSRTPTTGDNGIDLIAEKDNIRICLQCKFYSGKVGNSAVQEASAGCLHYQETHSGVVSNNSFTKAAIRLAETNMVLLLHHSDLQRLEEIILK